MKLQVLLYKLYPPCPRCPYRLGLIKTTVNPCPQCKMNGYNSYITYRKLLKEDNHVQHS